MGELGGGYSTGGTIAQTTTTSLSETVDLTQDKTRGNLDLGLFNGTVVGTGVTSVTFTLVADGITEINQTFSSAAAALAYFKDGVPTYIGSSSLASGEPLGGNTLTLKATLSVTTDGAGSGFYGGLIIGDGPTAQKPAAQTHSFVQAMAGLGAGAGTHAVLAGDAVQARPPMLAVNHLAQLA